MKEQTTTMTLSLLVLLVVLKNLKKYGIAILILHMKMNVNFKKKIIQAAPETATSLVEKERPTGMDLPSVKVRETLKKGAKLGT